MKKSRKRKAAIAVIAALTAATVIPSLPVPVPFILEAASKKGTATKKLDLYTGPNGQKIVKNGAYVTVPKGTSVTIEGERDGYYYIKFKGTGVNAGVDLVGWVVKSGIKVSSSATPSPSPSTGDKNKNVTVSNLSIGAKSIADSLRVRTGAGMDKKQLTINGEKVVLTMNQKATILKEKVINGKVWYYVKFTYKDSTVRKGYVLSDYVKITVSSAKPVAAKINSASKVKIRKKAGVSSAVLKVSGKEVALSGGKTVKIIAETVANSKKWFKVKFTYKDSKKTGYLLANAVIFKAGKKKEETPSPEPSSTAQPTSPSAPTETPIPTDQPDPVTPGGITTQVPMSQTPVPTQTPVTEPTAVPTAEPTAAPTKTPSTIEVKKGIVTADYLNVRTAPSSSQPQLYYNGKKVQLMTGDVTTILEEKSVNNEFWYHVEFVYKGVVLKGYVSAKYIQVKIEQENVSTASPAPSHTSLSDAEFEQKMTEENFPQSYKEALRALHKQYPLWQFQADHTGLKWDTVIKKESKLGKNLILNNKSIAWKSLEDGAYDWTSDTFQAFDGTSWVAPSKEALEYYMDPRNFLNPSSMFQFQILSYHAEYQTAEGVDSVLKNTPMYQASYSYTENGKKITYTYADTFIKAAEYSGVNPYHLATRVKQEVVTSKTSMSSSVSGTVSGYKGIYNFYNIGASHSTVIGGNVANGLNFAKTGTGNAANDKLFLIPWNNKYKAIVGGAKYIGNNYINKGQDTVYLQKFNVTDTSTYNHQYMANIEAPNAESVKTANAYTDMKDIPVSFSIPVYEDMPETPCEVPSGGKNPNNWLKKLTVTGYSMTPAFHVNDDKNQEYVITIPESVSSVQINASAVSSLAEVSGSGTIALEEGSNVLRIKVKAEDGSVRTYVIRVQRK